MDRQEDNVKPAFMHVAYKYVNWNDCPAMGVSVKMYESPESCKIFFTLSWCDSVADN
jgi:hypothetical protein